MLTNLNGKNYQVIKIPIVGYSCIRTVLAHIFPDTTLESYDLSLSEVHQLTEEMERKELMIRLRVKV